MSNRMIAVAVIPSVMVIGHILQKQLDTLEVVQYYLFLDDRS